ncbi:MAG: hypothetical protein IJ109_04020, partial [Firmicutes bacterium]|nr:hypothetical protein [Bacillota bacterium]
MFRIKRADQYTPYKPIQKSPSWDNWWDLKKHIGWNAVIATPSGIANPVVSAKTRQRRRLCRVLAETETRDSNPKWCCRE